MARVLEKSGAVFRPASRATKAPRVNPAVCAAVSDSKRSVPVDRVQSALTTAARNAGKMCASTALSVLLVAGDALARPEPVNKPELLPKGDVQTVIDVAGFLTDSEERRIMAQIAGLEEDTGFRLRVLAQNYPETPGLAIKNYWGVDDNTIVFVADPGFGDILNFNVGGNVDLSVPQSFWSRLAGKYGNKFYWQQNGEEASILNAVSAINTCLREPPGRLQCSTIQGEFGEQPTSGKFGGLFGGKK